MTTHQETADVLEELVQEISARRHTCHEAGVGGVAELPEPPRPILIILDEFHWLTHAEQSVMDSAELRPLRARIAVAVGKIAREGSAAAVSLVVSTQQPDLGWFPGPGNLALTMSRLVLGPAYGSQSGTGVRFLRTFELGRQQGIYQPLSRRGCYVDITMF